MHSAANWRSSSRGRSSERPRRDPIRPRTVAPSLELCVKLSETGQSHQTADCGRGLKLLANSPKVIKSQSAQYSTSGTWVGTNKCSAMHWLDSSYLCPVHLIFLREGCCRWPNLNLNIDLIWFKFKSYRCPVHLIFRKALRDVLASLIFRSKKFGPCPNFGPRVKYESVYRKTEWVTRRSWC